MTDHTHPNLERRISALEHTLNDSTAILLDIRELLDTRLAAVETGLTALQTGLTEVAASVVGLDSRLQRIEHLLDERLGRNGPNR